MFNLSALVALTIFNLIAVLQVASSSSRNLQDALKQGTAVLCLVVSLAGLGLSLLTPSLGTGIATVSIAALVNVIALLGPGAQKLSDPGIAEAAAQLRGLARLYIIGSPYSPVAAAAAPAGKAPIVVGPVEMPIRAPSKTTSRPASTEAIRSIRTARPSAQGSASVLLPRITADVDGTRRSLPGTMRLPARPRVDIDHLAPRTTYQVPQRPNRLPTDSLAFLLSVDTEPDIFANARDSMNRLPALGKRVRLHAPNPLPDTLSGPDPVWVTSYGRLPALQPSA